MSVLEISSSQHPVKAGLSDAFMTLNTSPDIPGESPGSQQRPPLGWTQLTRTQAGGGGGGEQVDGWRVEWELREERGRREVPRLLH